MTNNYVIDGMHTQIYRFYDPMLTLSLANRKKVN